MQVNPSDPLPKQGSETQRNLFQQFVDSSAGLPNEEVAGAAVNLLINVIRQKYPTRASAEKAFDELMGKSKGLLLDGHYDSVTNQRRNIFPFHQIVQLPPLDLNKVKTYGSKTI